MKNRIQSQINLCHHILTHGYIGKEFGKVSDDELRGQTWSGLVWELGDYEIRLLSHNGHFQLYLNFE